MILSASLREFANKYGASGERECKYVNGKRKFASYNGNTTHPAYVR